MTRARRGCSQATRPTAISAAASCTPTKESISLGIVATIGDLMQSSETPLYQMLEDLKRHPAVAPLIKGAKVIEHSAIWSPREDST